MTSPKDPEYAATVRLLRGEARLGPPFDRLAAAVEATWGVRVVNVVHDRSLHGRPRLQVLVWDEDDVAPFRDGAGFDREAQAAIADRFKSLLGWTSRLRYSTTGLFVVFAAFAPLARWEAVGRVTEADLEARIRDAGVPDLWGVKTCFDGIVVFVHTDAQVTEAEARREACVAAVLDLLGPHDPFGVLTLDTLRLSFDSKERFDRDFGGSWFGYWR